MNTLFINASILAPDYSIIKGDLGVKGNLIEFTGEKPPDFAADRIIDCNGDLLIPGMVNSHTHLPMSLFRSMADNMTLHDWLQNRIWPLEEMLDGESCFWGTQLAAAEMIRAGVTACNDMYFYSHDICRAIAQSGMRGLIARTLVDEGLEAKIIELKELHDRWHGAENDRIRVSVSPHAEYTCSESTLIRCRELRDELSLKFHFHVSETLDEHQQCKSRHDGKTVVALLADLGLLTGDSLLAHCVHVEQHDLELISSSGATVLHSPKSNCKLGSGIAPVPSMLRAGCNVALSTDGAASNNALNMFEEMRFAALIHNGNSMDPCAVSSGQAINMATINGAKALGWNAGKLSPGCLADIVRINLDHPALLPRSDLAAHLVYCANSGNVSMTMIDGEICYENGEYLTLDFDRIKSEVGLIYKNLL